MVEDLFIAVIKNYKGEYFKSYSYYSGVSWTTDIKKAKVYTKMGGARTRVTLIADHMAYKKINEPIPTIIQFTISGYIDHDQTERIRIAKEKQKVLEEKRKVAHALWQKEQAQRDYDEAKKRLDKLGKKLQEF